MLNYTGNSLMRPPLACHCWRSGSRGRQFGATDNDDGPTHVAALVNTGWLLALNVGVVVDAIRRLVSGAAEVHGPPVLIVSAIAAVVMFIGAIIVGGDFENDDGAEDLNVKAVLLDTAADAAAAGGVTATAVILATRGWYWLDPAVALVLAVVIDYHAVVLIWCVVATCRRTQRHKPPAAQTNDPGSARPRTCRQRRCGDCEPGCHRPRRHWLFRPFRG